MRWINESNRNPWSSVAPFKESGAERNFRCSRAPLGTHFPLSPLMWARGEKAIRFRLNCPRFLLALLHSNLTAKSNIKVHAPHYNKISMPNVLKIPSNRQHTNFEVTKWCNEISAEIRVSNLFRQKPKLESVSIEIIWIFAPLFCHCWVVSVQRSKELRSCNLFLEPNQLPHFVKMA